MTDTGMGLVTQKQYLRFVVNAQPYINRRLLRACAGVIIGLAAVLSPRILSAQQDADTVIFRPGRMAVIGSAGAVIAGGTLFGLAQFWYRDQPMSSFQFFDDNASWYQMDKVGHTMTAYYMGHMGIKAMQWTGTARKKAVWIGGTYGLAYLTAIEVLDGFSQEWGFSLGDFAANAAGAGIVIAEELLWREQRILIKYSARHTDYARYRPEVLGSGGLERLLKDYNGQTYWASVNIAAWMKQKPRWLPAWLNVAAGYGVDGLTGGTANVLANEAGAIIPPFERQRQFYLSFDVDFTHIPTRSKVLRTCFDLLSFVKIPAPAIEFNSGGDVRGHWLYW